jgi:3-isopropylmalate/(R)-2-methylmalate dehydratase small subunit
MERFYINNKICNEIFDKIEANPKIAIKVDLPNQTLEVVGTDLKTTFEIDHYKKTCLTNGYDDIDYIISQREAVKAFEGKREFAYL